MATSRGKLTCAVVLLQLVLLSSLARAQPRTLRSADNSNVLQVMCKQNPHMTRFNANLCNRNTNVPRHTQSPFKQAIRYG